jgi:hypothetical protein
VLRAFFILVRKGDMNHSHLLMSESQNAQSDRPPHRELKVWQVCGAILGVGGGLILGIWGAMLWSGAWSEESLARGIAPLIIFVAIPLLILGGHCLDLLEIPKKRSDLKPEDETPGLRVQEAKFRFNPQLTPRQIQAREKLLQLIRARIRAGRP